MLNYRLLLLALIYFAFAGNAQEITYSLADSIQFPKNEYRKFIGIDTQENLFFQKNEVITKVKDNKKWVYSNFQLGIPTSVSFLNPLQILVFYKDTNTFVLLDQFMNEARRVDLNSVTPTRVANFIENTKNQEIWLFNSITNKLEFFNYQTGTSNSKSIPLATSPSAMCSNFNSAYLLLKDLLCKYNNYGTLINCIPNEGVSKLSLSNNKLIGLKGNEFLIFDEALKFTGRLIIPKNIPQDFSLRDEKLYIYSKSSVYVYQLTIPSK